MKYYATFCCILLRFSTPFEQLIQDSVFTSGRARYKFWHLFCPYLSTEKATDGGLASEDWALNLEICDIINETDEGLVECKISKAFSMFRYSIWAYVVTISIFDHGGDCIKWWFQTLLIYYLFPCRPKDAVKAIRKRLSNNKNFKSVLLTLTVSLNNCKILLLNLTKKIYWTQK